MNPLLLLIAIFGTICFHSSVAEIDSHFMGSSEIKSNHDWSLISRANKDSLHSVIFAIKQQNLHQLEGLLYAISTPGNTNYGQHWTRQKVADFTSNPIATQKILQFLRHNQIHDIHTTLYGEYIIADGKVSIWERLFQTVFYQFDSNNDGKRNHPISTMKPKKSLLRALNYSIPIELIDSIEVVFGTIEFPVLNSFVSSSSFPTHKNHLMQTTTTTTAGTTTPPLINSYYQISSNTGSFNATQSVFETAGRYFSPSDLSQFQTQFNIPQQSISQEIGNHSSDSACSSDPNTCAEANIDVQYIIAISQGSPTTFWYDDSDDAFLSWITAVANMSNPPLVLSFSYIAVESNYPNSSLNQFNIEAMKLGLQGVSIIVSSGDDGVAGLTARNDSSQCGYNPSFPSTSPYVTSIGATQGPESGSAEIALTSNNNGGLATTGGGFSNIFTAPSYQTAAISGYFSQLSQQPVSGYSTSGRGYPDLAMIGLNYEVVIGGSTFQGSGTSPAAPVVGGMVSLINAARLQSGKSSLGFLNPSIYQYGTQFTNDITSGESNCAGFTATTGWDPLTGFGSVNFQKFSEIFENL